MLAETINNILMKDYKALIAQGCPTKFPIILHRHICLMETKVYIQDAIVQ
jgi:hypothetical protein